MLVLAYVASVYCAAVPEEISIKYTQPNFCGNIDSHPNIC